MKPLIYGCAVLVLLFTGVGMYCHLTTRESYRSRWVPYVFGGLVAVSLGNVLWALLTP